MSSIMSSSSSSSSSSKQLQLLLKPTIQELFDAIEETVNANPNNIKSKFNANVEFHVKEGSSSSKDENESTIVVNIAKTNKTKPDLLIVHVDLDVFHLMLNKKLTPQRAFMKNQLKIKGNMGLAMKMTLILNSTRKTLLLKQKQKQNQNQNQSNSLLRSKL